MTKPNANSYNSVVNSISPVQGVAAPLGLITDTSAITLNTNLNKIDISNVVTEKKEIISKLTGIKLRVAGRLARQRVIPKRTVQSAYKGRVSKAKLNLVDSSTFTGKNRKGAYSIKV